MSLLNPVVTCGYVNTVCYVVNNGFFVHMDSCQLVTQFHVSCIAHPTGCTTGCVHIAGWVTIL